VLVGNHVEDRFGQELVQAPTPKWGVPPSEAQSNYTMASSMSGYGRENFETKVPADSEEFWERKQYQEFQEKVNPKKGQPGHIFFGHGASQDAFEKRDFGTTNDLVYEKKMKTEKFINPHFYETDKKKIRKDFINTRVEDIPVYGQTGT
jgi:hypothetical protein